MKQSCVGIDLIEIERIRKAVYRWGERFLSRVYTRPELEHCRGRIDSLAARFAAKEAAIKALNLAGYIVWRDIEIVTRQDGKPMVNLHDQALKKARELGLSNLEVSLSHTKENAIAIVIGVREG